MRLTIAFLILFSACDRDAGNGNENQQDPDNDPIAGKFNPEFPWLPGDPTLTSPDLGVPVDPPVENPDMSAPTDPCAGVTCPAGQTCQNGTCVDNTPPDMATPPPPCGHKGEACCATQPKCGDDLICYKGTCEDDSATCDPLPRIDCASTLGYYKNHACWPVRFLTLGRNVYGPAELQMILDSSTMSNGLTILARQLIAAKLNMYSGADVGLAIFDIADADILIGDLVVLVDSLPTADTASLVSALDAFNSGLGSAPSCK